MNKKLENLLQAYKEAGEQPDYDPLNPDAHFDTLLFADQHLDPFTAVSNPIPPIAHFIYTDTTDPTWINWLAIKGAILHLGVKKVKIWIPRYAELEGEMWRRILAFKEVELSPTEFPKSVYGVQLEDMGATADVMRLKILYEEGGAYILSA